MTSPVQIKASDVQRGDRVWAQDDRSWLLVHRIDIDELDVTLYRADGSEAIFDGDDIVLCDRSGEPGDTALDLLDMFDRWGGDVDYVGSPFQKRVVALLHAEGRRSEDGTLCLNGDHLHTDAKS